MAANESFQAFFPVYRRVRSKKRGDYPDTIRKRNRACRHLSWLWSPWAPRPAGAGTPGEELQTRKKQIGGAELQTRGEENPSPGLRTWSKVWRHRTVGRAVIEFLYGARLFGCKCFWEQREASLWVSEFPDISGKQAKAGGPFIRNTRENAHTLLLWSVFVCF